MNEIDVAVIGGGVVGLSCALTLAESGASVRSSLNGAVGSNPVERAIRNSASSRSSGVPAARSVSTLT